MICRTVYGLKSCGWSCMESGSLITRYCVVDGRKLMRCECALSFGFFVVEVVFNPYCFVELLVYNNRCHIDSSGWMLCGFIALLFFWNWC